MGLATNQSGLWLKLLTNHQRVQWGEGAAASLLFYFITFYLVLPSGGQGQLQGQ